MTAFEPEEEVMEEADATPGPGVALPPYAAGGIVNGTVYAAPFSGTVTPSNVPVIDPVEWEEIGTAATDQVKVEEQEEDTTFAWPSTWTTTTTYGLPAYFGAPVSSHSRWGQISYGLPSYATGGVAPRVVYGGGYAGYLVIISGLQPGGPSSVRSSGWYYPPGDFEKPGTEPAEFDFTVGSLTGLRGFRLWPDGSLTGLSYCQRYHTGENLAACYVLNQEDPAVGTRQSWALLSAHLRFAGEPYDRDQDRPCHESDGQAFADCHCGFYAYNDPAWCEVGQGSNIVTGVVEAYGRVVIGSKGFRAEKVRVRALALPQADADLSYHDPTFCPVCTDEERDQCRTASGWVPRVARDLQAAWEPLGVRFYPSMTDMLKAHPLTKEES